MAEEVTVGSKTYVLFDLDDIDQETGMPRLPDKYFWRISKAPFFGLKLFLCKKNGFSTSPVSNQEIYYSGEDDQYNVAKAVGRIHSKQQLYYREAIEKERLVGDYPPNKISKEYK